MVFLNLRQQNGVTLPDGTYKANWSANTVTIKDDSSYNGIKFKTPIYVKGIDVPCEVNVEKGHPSMRYL